MELTHTFDVPNCTEPVQRGETWITCTDPIVDIRIEYDMGVDLGEVRRIRVRGLCHTHLFAWLHAAHLAEERGDLVIEPRVRAKIDAYTKEHPEHADGAKVH